MRAEITLDQLEHRAALAMDFAASVRRPLLGPERDSLRWLLVASKCATVTFAVKKMRAAERSSHHRMMTRLEKLINPDPRETLAHLVDVTTGFIEYARSLERPLLKSERKAWGWLLAEWDGRAIKSAVETISDQKHEEIKLLISMLVQILAPEPVKQIHLDHQPAGNVAELNAGNFSLRNPLFRGASPHRLTGAEAAQRVALLSQLCKGIGVIAKELSLVRSQDGEEAAKIAKAAKRVGKHSRDFADKRAAIQKPQTERPIEEVMEESQQLERIAQLDQLCKDIKLATKKIGRNQDRADLAKVAKIIKGAAAIAKHARAFVARCKASPEIPSQRSLEEVMHEAQVMAELMKPISEEGATE